MPSLCTVWGSVDIGGTNIAVAIASDDGEIVAQTCIPTRSEEGPSAVIGRIADAVRESGSEPKAIGAGVPGLADLRRGHTLFLPNMPGNWRDVSLAPELQARLGCPVYLLNDVRMATLGELTFGSGRGVRDMVFFAIGTGIGGGAVLDGRLRLGPLGSAGEFGHQTIVPDGPLCGCGNRGCLETLASGPAIAAEGVRLMRSGLAPRLHAIAGGSADAVTTKAMAEADDPAVRDAIERAAVYLGIGVSNVVTALHPELVVLGGGVAGVGPFLVDTVRETVRRRVRMFPVDEIRVERSQLGDAAGLYGGIALARQGGCLQETTWSTHTTTSQK